MRDLLDKLILLEGGEAADFGDEEAMDAERASGNLGKKAEVPGYYKDKGVDSYDKMPKLKVQDENPGSGVQKAGFEIGDEFGISLEEEFEIGTTITGFVEDGIIIDLDDDAIEYLSRNGVKFFEGEVVEDCWKGYKQIGMKKKGKKEVPNCVPEASDPNLRQADQKTAAVKDPKTGDEWNPYSPNPKGSKKKDPVDDLFDENSPANPEEAEMAMNQLNFIEYAAKELKEYIGDGGNFPEWFQNKMSGVFNDIRVLHSYLEGERYKGESSVDEAEYQGRKVALGKPMQGDVKKFKVYVKNPKGNIVKVNFGDPNMRIKKSNPARRKSFRARHNCSNPGPRHKARYWSCRKW